MEISNESNNRLQMSKVLGPLPEELEEDLSTTSITCSETFTGDDTINDSSLCFFSSTGSDVMMAVPTDNTTTSEVPLWDDSARSPGTQAMSMPAKEQQELTRIERRDRRIKELKAGREQRLAAKARDEAGHRFFVDTEHVAPSSPGLSVPRFSMQEHPYYMDNHSKMLHRGIRSFSGSVKGGGAVPSRRRHSIGGTSTTAENCSQSESPLYTKADRQPNNDNDMHSILDSELEAAYHVIQKQRIRIQQLEKTHPRSPFFDPQVLVGAARLEAEQPSGANAFVLVQQLHGQLCKIQCARAYGEFESKREMSRRHYVYQHNMAQMEGEITDWKDLCQQSWQTQCQQMKEAQARIETLEDELRKAGIRPIDPVHDEEEDYNETKTQESAWGSNHRQVLPTEQQGSIQSHSRSLWQRKRSNKSRKEEREDGTPTQDKQDPPPTKSQKSGFGRRVLSSRRKGEANNES